VLAETNLCLVRARVGRLGNPDSATKGAVHGCAGDVCGEWQNESSGNGSTVRVGGERRQGLRAGATRLKGKHPFQLATHVCNSASLLFPCNTHNGSLGSRPGVRGPFLGLPRLFGAVALPGQP
jgi:hypothetical protein